MSDAIAQNLDQAPGSAAPPRVAMWRIWMLRFLFALIAVILGWQQWSAILEGTPHDWPAWKGLGRAMLAVLSVLAMVGIFQPLKLIIVMVYEMAWKTLWLLMVALPTYLEGRDMPTIMDVTINSLGMVLLLCVIPWRYVWWQLFGQPSDPWRAAHAS
ncbi:MAG: hypothetical protein AAGA34_10985 [Pseudomonadota bacterium]